MANYFVTGATGFIGGEIVKRLVSRGHRVVALVRSPDKAGLLKALGVEMHAGDLTDRDTLRATSSRPCERLSFSPVAVFSDTQGAVPDETYRYAGPHLSQYDRTKWIAHYRVAQPKIDEGLPLTIVMPGLVYGPVPGSTHAGPRAGGRSGCRRCRHREISVRVCQPFEVQED